MIQFISEKLAIFPEIEYENISKLKTVSNSLQLLLLLLLCSKCRVDKDRIIPYTSLGGLLYSSHNNTEQQRCMFRKRNTDFQPSFPI